MSAHVSHGVVWEVWIEPPGFMPFRFMDCDWSDARTADSIREWLSDDVRPYAYCVEVTRRPLR